MKKKAEKEGRKARNSSREGEDKEEGKLHTEPIEKTKNSEGESEDELPQQQKRSKGITWTRK